MKLTAESWKKLIDCADDQFNGIVGKSARHGFNVDAKNGSIETIVTMITELESTLRVLKRRLQKDGEVPII